LYIFIINNNINTILEINNKYSRLHCLHKTYEKAQAKRNKINNKKVFNMKKSQSKVELGNVYPEGTDMKELVNNLIVEYKSIKEKENFLAKDTIDSEDFFNKDYRDNYLR
tara:strand:- start:9756 stop:10085 length:330 start_codon:yes stop_codon:yes gene_type:complete